MYFEMRDVRKDSAADLTLVELFLALQSSWREFDKSCDKSCNKPRDLGHKWQSYEITVAPSLRPHGTLRKRLRNININDKTQVKQVTRHPGVSTPKLKIKPRQK